MLRLFNHVQMRQFCARHLQNNIAFKYCLQNEFSSNSTPDIENIRNQYTFAYESVQTIVESAKQAQLEHEPACRRPAEEYRARYARFALTEVEKALKMYETYCNANGLTFGASSASSDSADYSSRSQPDTRTKIEIAFLRSYRDTLHAVLKKADVDDTDK